MDIKTTIIGVLIITTLVFGYFAFMLDKESDSFSMKEKCRKVGSEVHQKIVNERDESNQTYGLAEPQYAYSKELETCLYAGGSLSVAENGKVIRQKWVKDSFTNEEILSHTSIGGELMNGINQHEYEIEKDLLFD